MEKFRQIWEKHLDITPNGVFQTDVNSNCVNVNKRWSQITGLTETQSWGKGWQNCIHPEDKPRFLKWWNDATTIQENVGVIEYRLVTNTEQEVWVVGHVVSLRDDFGERVGFLGIFQNISKLKHANKELEESSQIWKVLAECCPDNVLMVDREKKVTYINWSIPGMTKADVIGLRADVDFLQPIEAKRVGGFLDSVLATGIHQTYETEFFGPDREQFYYETTAVPLYKNETEIVGLIMYSRNITERKVAAIEKEKLEKKIYLSSKLASIGKLSAGIGHEISNPLTILKGHLYGLRSGLIDDTISKGEMLLKIDRLEQSVSRIDNIVKGLKTFARTDGDTLEIVEINQIILNTMSFMESLLKHQNIEVFTKLAEEELAFQGNIGKFQQVLINLITNAQDALKDTKEKRILISTELINDKVHLTVTDNGQGIRVENESKIFDSFFTTKEVGHGTGLGLGIVRSIIEGIGGEIDFDTIPNEGTSFCVTVPNVNLLLESGIESVSQPIS